MFVFVGIHSHIESSQGLCEIDASEWVGLAQWLMLDLTHKILIFVKIPFNFKKKNIKNISSNIDKPSGKSSNSKVGNLVLTL